MPAQSSKKNTGDCVADKKTLIDRLPSSLTNKRQSQKRNHATSNQIPRRRKRTTRKLNQPGSKKLCKPTKDRNTETINNRHPCRANLTRKHLRQHDDIRHSRKRNKHAEPGNNTEQHGHSRHGINNRKSGIHSSNQQHARN